MTEVAPWTVRRLLEWTSGFFTRKDVHSPRLSAEQLLAHVLKYPRIRLYTEYERPLSDPELVAFRALVQRASEPEQIETLDRSVKDYEPLMALDGGIDGLAIHRRILEGAADRLLPSGRVYLEIAFDQGPAARNLAAEYEGFEDARILKDHAGNDR